MGGPCETPPKSELQMAFLNLRGERVWEIQMFVGSKGNLSLKDRGAMPRHIIFRDAGSIHTRNYIYI